MENISDVCSNMQNCVNVFWSTQLVSQNFVSPLFNASCQTINCRQLSFLGSQSTDLQ